MSQNAAGAVIAGASWPGLPGVPPADLSRLGRTLAALLPPVTAYFDPKIAELQVSPAVPVALYDRVNLGGKWSAEDSNSGPAAITINGKPALAFLTGGGHPRGLRSTVPIQNLSCAVIGAFEVTSASLAIVSHLKMLFAKYAGSNELFGLQVNTSNHLIFTTPTSGGGDGHDLGAIAAGVYVFCASLDAVGNTVEFFLNNATTPVLTGTPATPIAITLPWTVGNIAAPSDGDGWESNIGHICFMDNSTLHGTADLDKRRTGAMQALAQEYGVSLTG